MGIRRWMMPKNDNRKKFDFFQTRIDFWKKTKLTSLIQILDIRYGNTKRKTAGRKIDGYYLSTKSILCSNQQKYGHATPPYWWRHRSDVSGQTHQNDLNARLWKSVFLLLLASNNCDRNDLYSAFGPRKSLTLSLSSTGNVGSMTSSIWRCVPESLLVRTQYRLRR